MTKKIIYSFGFYTSLLLLVSCSALSFESTDVVSSQTTAKIKQQTHTNEQSFQLNDTLNKTLIAYSVYNDKVPRILRSQLDRILTQKIKSYSIVSIVATPEKAKQKLLTLKMKEKANLYFSTLTQLAISDKNLALPISKTLSGNSLLVFTITAWPCDSCLPKFALSSKLLLVNVKYSSILWTATATKTLNKQTISQATKISKAMLENMLHQFHVTFKAKWHKKQYEALLIKNNKKEKNLATANMKVIK